MHNLRFRVKGSGVSKRFGVMGLRVTICNVIKRVTIVGSWPKGSKFTLLVLVSV
jgi:hypothetical protein